jgi:hypothetical protein
MMDFHSSADFQVTQNFPDRRMRYFVYGLAILDLRVDQPDSMVEKWWQISAGKIAVLVDRRR